MRLTLPHFGDPAHVAWTRRRGRTHYLPASLDRAVRLANDKQARAKERPP
jgi:hypothetical protein